MNPTDPEAQYRTYTCRGGYDSIIKKNQSVSSGYTFYESASYDTTGFDASLDTLERGKKYLVWKNYDERTYGCGERSSSVGVLLYTNGKCMKTSTSVHSQVNCTFNPMTCTVGNFWDSGCQRPLSTYGGVPSMTNLMPGRCGRDGLFGSFFKYTILTTNENFNANVRSFWGRHKY